MLRLLKKSRFKPRKVCKCGEPPTDRNSLIHRKEDGRWVGYHARCLQLANEAARPK